MNFKFLFSIAVVILTGCNAHSSEIKHNITSINEQISANLIFTKHDSNEILQTNTTLTNKKNTKSSKIPTDNVINKRKNRNTTDDIILKIPETPIFSIAAFPLSSCNIV
ncbi:MAG: hypothetical protein IJ848_02420 [Alphaproteobacteria bacterium]|nr:hypothetical protein [Alphaproteobacteria bacterium]